MHNVTTRPRFTAKSTARSLRAFMRDQHVTPATLAWIIGCNRPRAVLLRYGSSRWTVQDVCRLVAACSPASASVPVFGILTQAAA